MSFSEWIIDRIGGQTMFYPTCSMLCSVDIVRYGVSHAKNLGSTGLWYKLVGQIFLPHCAQSISIYLFF